MDASDQISAVVGAYVEAMVFADEAALRDLFHPSCAIVGNYQGAVEWLTLEEFIAAILLEGRAPEGTRPFWEIELIDRTADSAVVRVVDDFAGMRFTDHLSLLRIHDHWRIVHKLYHLHG